MIVSPVFAGKRYAVLGLARSGLATVDALHASGAHVLAWDNREDARAAVAGKAEVADLLEADLTGYDGIVVSPGVPINRHPIADKARESGVPLIGDIELFALARPSLPAHRVVGITGTNGKSTTTALIHHICRNAGLPARMGGNIGLPILAQEPLDRGGVYVLELSSYQIDLTYSLDCDVVALLNITPDHLDRYDGFDAYAASKERLLIMQSAGHASVVAADDAPTRIIADRLPHVTRAHADSIDPVEQLQWPALQGPHNAQNVAVARAVAEALHIGPRSVEDALRSYASLPHRMQIVGERDGVLFVNDSKATNAASTAPALSAWPARDGIPRIHWILGGLAKSDDLDDCAVGFPNVKHAYTIGEAGPVFAAILRDVVPVEESELLITAVAQAAANAMPGDVVLLSPACASFDQFRDFEARGDAFVAAVNALSGALGGGASR
ncbi:UDP-N-acetylmuramoyl-L-alanine--D-glutamate ligase [Sphingobium sufflavum]|uniref:UDP-N-acetylmuramoyl-L-alanine--D-glutamate ligase n=1 Tax=Sphingobium sufflavum TaxID=1129547 RepID=UPI001F30ADB0|nr:UDP-N-acetylmuramoyl-L-alanine--D-glutamate ligase [Sphingobium sufflavum]MCE7795874.1 UDP-N-acetylmuramoyl-L-alanine--D-glutamate ligase [Sphingobium sufflavum]